MLLPKKIIVSLLFCCLIFAFSFISQSLATQINTSQVAGHATSPVLQSLDNQPLLFVQNKGQMDDTVKYYETSPNHASYFAADGIYLTLFRPQTLPGQSDFAQHENEHSNRSDKLKLCFINTAAKPVIEAENKQGTKYNYYIGKDPAGWHENIPTYRTVTYTDIYPNIDLKIYGNNRRLEYDVIVRPGGDPAAVQFQYKGANSLAVNSGGELEIKLNHGTLVQKAPSLYQEISGRRVAITGHFKLLPDNAYTFSIAAYDPTKTLIIDPVIEYSKYLTDRCVYHYNIEHYKCLCRHSNGCRYNSG